jgi:D-3-phosphoglycerate dehydrogenase
MKVLAYDEFRNEQWAAENNITYCATLDELLKNSDFISIHVPLIPSTANMIGKRELALMKPRAYLVNCARGGIINEADLYEALKNHVIAGAAMDASLILSLSTGQSAPDARQFLTDITRDNAGQLA